MRLGFYETYLAHYLSYLFHSADSFAGVVHVGYRVKMTSNIRLT